MIGLAKCCKLYLSELDSDIKKNIIYNGAITEELISTILVDYSIHRTLVSIGGQS